MDAPVGESAAASRSPLSPLIGEMSRSDRGVLTLSALRATFPTRDSEEALSAPLQGSRRAEGETEGLFQPQTLQNVRLYRIILAGNLQIGISCDRNALLVQKAVPLQVMILACVLIVL